LYSTYYDSKGVSGGKAGEFCPTFIDISIVSSAISFISLHGISQISTDPYTSKVTGLLGSCDASGHNVDKIYAKELTDLSFDSLSPYLLSGRALFGVMQVTQELYFPQDASTINRRKEDTQFYGFAGVTVPLQ